MNIILTVLEQKALIALLQESAGNGHDFGLLEAVNWEGDRKQLGGLFTQLQKKDIIKYVDIVDVNGGPRQGGERYTQYVLSSEVTGS